jgi:putative transposase
MVVQEDHKAFYDDLCKDISSHLLSHKDIDNAMPLCDKSSCVMNIKSWFSTKQVIACSSNTQNNYIQAFFISRAECTVSSATMLKSRRIRIYPSQQQKQLFKQWIGVGRKVYNTCINHFNKKDIEFKGWMKMGTMVLSELTEDYIKSVPYQIKKIAVKDAYTSWQTNCKKTKKSGKPFKLHYKSLKNPVQSCYIPKSAVSESGIYHTISGKLKFSEKEWFKNDICDCRLINDHGRWYLSVPQKLTTISTENQGGIVALDPGVRNFLTYFSEDGRFGWLGMYAFNRILTLNLKRDKLFSRLVLTKDKKKKSKLKRSLNRTYHRMHDLVDELHWKCINYLVHNFSVIVFPPFEVKGMTKKGRKLRKSVVRSMLSLRFYEFKERLKQKCKECGVAYIEQNESYTSKTNSFTGELMTNLGGKEWFVYDGIKIHRDLNGARNILIRAMRDSSAVG